MNIMFLGVALWPGRILSDKYFWNLVSENLLAKGHKVVMAGISDGQEINGVFPNGIEYITWNRAFHRFSNKEYIAHPRHSRYFNAMEINVSFLSRIKEILHVAKSKNIDVFHCVDHIAPAIILKYMLRPMPLTTVKPTVSVEPSIADTLYYKSLNGYTRVVAFTEFTKNILEKQVGLNNVSVIPWGIQLVKRSEDKIAAKRELLNTDCTVVCISDRYLFCGNSTYDNYVEIIANAMSSIPNVRVIVKIRDHHILFPRQKWVDKYMVPNNVDFMDVLQASDIYLLPYNEKKRTPLPPLAILEAMYRGALVVAAEGTLLEKVFCANKEFMQYRSIEEIVDMIRNVRMYLDIVNNAMDKVRCCYNVNTISDVYIKMWQGLLGK